MSSSNIRLKLSDQKIMKICNVYVLGDHMYLMMFFANSPKNSFLSIKCLKLNDPAQSSKRIFPLTPAWYFLTLPFFLAILLMWFLYTIIKAVSANTYYVVGKMIATCIIQGGEVPTCFAKAVADYLVFDRVICVY